MRGLQESSHGHLGGNRDTHWLAIMDKIKTVKSLAAITGIPVFDKALYTEAAAS